MTTMTTEHGQATALGFAYLAIFEVWLTVSVVPNTPFVNLTAGALSMSNSEFRMKHGLGVNQHGYCDGKNNMCLFQCIAQAALRKAGNHKLNETYARPTKAYFEDCYNTMPAVLCGVDLTNQKEFNKIGETLNINVNNTVYSKGLVMCVSSPTARHITKSTWTCRCCRCRCELPTCSHLNLELNVDNAFKSYVCKTCGMSFDDTSQYSRHINNPGACKVVKMENGQKRTDAIVKESFDHPSMLALPLESQMVGHNTLHEYFITWDTESWMKHAENEPVVAGSMNWLKRVVADQRKLKMVAVQQPLSVSFYSNFTNVCEHLCEADPEVLVS